MSAAPQPSWVSLFRTARASVGVLVVAAVGLLLPSQTGDELAALSDVDALLPGLLALQVAVALLSFAAWYWARAALSARAGFTGVSGHPTEIPDGAPVVPGGAFVAVPRILFIAGVVIGAALMLRSFSLAHASYVLVWAIPGYALIHWRGKMMKLQPGKLPKPLQEALSTTRSLGTWLKATPGRLEALLRCAPFGLPAAASLLALAVLAFVAGAVETFVPMPADYAGLAAFTAVAFPGPSVALIGLALMVAPLTVMTFVADGLRLEWDIRGTTVGLRRPPVFTVLVIYILVMPYVFSLHAVRVMPPAARTVDVAARKPLEHFFAKWVEACGQQDATAPVRPVIVAVSGGASRAGVWGAQVLAAVDQAAGQHNTAIFAVSSVSGGSLGVAAYMAVAAQHPDATARCGGGKVAATLSTLTTDRLGGDALGPALAGSLLGDVPRSLFSPFAALVRWISGTSPRGGDRAEALERAFEHLWDQDSGRAGARVASFRAGFLSLFYQDGATIRPGMPLWIANGTNLQTGGRVLTTPFGSIPEATTKAPRVWSLDDHQRWPFRPAFDALGILDADVPISTAINNSARFPYLEPAGELSRATDPARQLRGDALDLLDGGYFENEGLLTALELATWLKTQSKHAGGREIRPIIVQATADADFLFEAAKTASPTGAPTVQRAPAQGASPPKVVDSVIVRCPHMPIEVPIDRQPRTGTLQIFAPVLGVYNVRAAHSAVLLRQARDEYCDPKDDRNHDRFFHFYLFKAADRAIPLNWILSGPTVKAITDQLKPHIESGNTDELRRMTTALGASAAR